MAIIKRRIMSRSQLLGIIYADHDNGILRLENLIDQSQRRQAQSDIVAYMLADGKEVKIFHDTNMGGNVVEFDDGK